MRRLILTSFISLSSVVVLAILMSPVLIAADRPMPLPSQETNGLAPSEPALGPRAPAWAGRRATTDVQNSSQAVPADPVGKPPTVVLDTSKVGGILGQPVRSAANESMGRIIDIIVDRTGLPRAAVIDFGGFLGVGSRKIVVDWSALHFGRVADKSDSITLELTKDQVRAAPEYKEDQPIVVLGASGILQPLGLDP
jgi:hypothetical protein